MILQLLKNHPTTARTRRPAITRNCALLAMATVLLLSSAMPLVAQQPFDAGGQESNPIYQAYQEQLKENQRRLSGSDDAYQQQIQKNQAAQVYMPPVHIAPQLPPRRSQSNRSLNGRFNPVQDFAAAHRPARVSLSDQQKVVRTRVPTRAQPKRVAKTSTVVSEAPSSDEHVFLQDRIANALTRTFSRKSNSPTVKFPTVSQQEHLSDVALTDKSPMSERPALGSVEREQYVSDEPELRYRDIHNAMADGQHGHNIENTEPFNSVLDLPEDESPVPATKDQSADVQLADVISPRLSVPEPSIQDSTRVVRSSYEVKRTETRAAKRARRLKAPRPATYRPKQNQRRAGEASILVGQEKEESLEDLDFDLPLENDRSLVSSSEEQLSSPPRSKAGSGTKPDLRDDLESVGDDDLDNGRIRSRLGDELEDLDDLDDIGEEPEVERPTERPCNEFRDELLSTSIRDISLDISPGAYSESARSGGLSRSWTDRSGNPIASGTMIDLRRGYVILDSGQKIPYSKLGASDLAAVSEFWRLPVVCLLGNRGGSPYRSWAPQTVTWKASSLCHKPLYFENRQLERYGHSRGPFAQPVHSTVHFFASLISLPYQTAITPANECQYALGFFRPGGCAPWLKDPIPISLAGARRQALLTTGGAFIP